MDLNKQLFDAQPLVNLLKKNLSDDYHVDWRAESFSPDIRLATSVLILSEFAESPCGTILKKVATIEKYDHLTITFEVGASELEIHEIQIALYNTQRFHE